MSWFSTLFRKEAESHALGIDIGSSAIKLVELKKKNGQAHLVTYGELSLGPYGGAIVGQAVQLPIDKISTALSDLMKEKEVGVTTRKCGLSIPFSSSLMTVIELPDLGPSKLSTMVPIEARKYIPVPIAEVMLDWSVVPKAENLPGADSQRSNTTDVLVVAIHKETIARYQDIVVKSGLEAGFFEIELFSTMRSVLDEGLRPVLVMDMGAASTKLYIVERGIIRMSHTINRGAQDITGNISKSLSLTPERAEILKREMGLTSTDLKEMIMLTLEYIWSEANNTVLAYEKKHNKTVSKVVLVGGGATLKGVIDLAKENFKTPVELGEPFDKVQAPAFLENILRQAGPEFAVAIGLALRKLAEE